MFSFLLHFLDLLQIYKEEKWFFFLNKTHLSGKTPCCEGLVVCDTQAFGCGLFCSLGPQGTVVSCFFSGRGCPGLFCCGLAPGSMFCGLGKQAPFCSTAVPQQTFSSLPYSLWEFIFPGLRAFLQFALCNLSFFEEITPDLRHFAKAYSALFGLLSLCIPCAVNVDIFP